MSMEPVHFRNPLLSLFQSTIESGVRAKLPADAPAPGLENGMVRAAAQVATYVDAGQSVPVATPANVSSAAWMTARLTYELLKAQLAGDSVRVAALEDQLRYGLLDVNWLRTKADYLVYYGLDGRLHKPMYIPPAPDMGVIPFKPGAVIGLMADWGTGTGAASRLVGQMARYDPDIVIHLGDIYYSGTRDECDRNFLQPMAAAFDRSKVAIYNLAGNHDMYCGGLGYYDMLKRLNPPGLPQQPASFFCLRCTDESWQFVAMDTGNSDHDPNIKDLDDVLVALDPAEEAWLDARIAEFPGRTILLSHHQYFSALDRIGPKGPDGSSQAYNPNLDSTLNRFQTSAKGRIAAWFWGHEHTLTIYAPYRGLQKGRCIGHGAVPVLLTPEQPHPMSSIKDPPGFQQVPLPADDQVYAHGFVMLQFAEDGSVEATYYDDVDGQKVLFSEPL